jgi:PAS domain S-box-containing protein
MAKDWAEILIDDHQTTERVFDAVAQAFAEPEGPSMRLLMSFRQYVSEYVDGCHNKKEENHVFPMAEQCGIPRQGGPLAVMLAEHEASEELLGRLQELIDRYVGGEQVLDELRGTYGEYTSLLKNHFWKETDILYPMVRRMIDDDDAAALLKGIEATEAKLGPDTRSKYYALADAICQMGQLEDLSSSLAKDVLAAMLNTLPVELTFVDADDVVRYFSHEHGEKLFPRTRGAVGGKVQDCHPEKSIHVVNQILRDFKAGTRDVAEFWLDFRGKKIHVRYFPVRNDAGEYLGCLEVAQDITAIQQLEGQRLLLDEETK